MAMTPEKVVKTKCTKLILAAGGTWFYPTTAGYGSSGASDIVACVVGRFIAVECKAGKNKPTELQKGFLRKVISAGGIGLVINEDNIDVLEAVLNMVKTSPQAVENYLAITRERWGY